MIGWFMQHVSGGGEETYYQISSHFSESLSSITFSTFKHYRFPLNYPLSTKIDLAGDFCFGNKKSQRRFSSLPSTGRRP